MPLFWWQFQPKHVFFLTLLTSLKLFIPLSSSTLSPPAGDFLVLSQKKISFVTWLKWQTKIPSPSCSTDPLLPRRPGGRRRRGGGVSPEWLQSLTQGASFSFSCQLCRPWTSQTCVAVRRIRLLKGFLAAEDTKRSRVEGTLMRKCTFFFTHKNKDIHLKHACSLTHAHADTRAAP